MENVKYEFYFKFSDNVITKFKQKVWDDVNENTFNHILNTIITSVNNNTTNIRTFIYVDNFKLPDGKYT